MFNFKKAAKYIVFIGLFSIFSFAKAGSYEDFFKAINLDDARSVSALLQRGFDPNTVNPEGVPGLLLAIRSSSFKVAEVLAASPEAKVDLRTLQDESPLMLAALRGQLNLASLLVARGAEINKTGWTPLHYAATGGHVPVIALLLDKKAAINAESPNGSTPLMMASMYGSPEAVKHLIQAGANLQVKNQLGLTALDFAQNASRQNNIELLQEGLRREAARQSRNAANQPAAAASAQGR